METRAILAPRRILVAAALFVLLTGASVMASGVSSKSSVASGPLPETFRMAEARVGDRGNYTYSHIRMLPDGTALIEEEHEIFAFEWQAPAMSLDVEGITHATNRLREWKWSPCPQCDAEDVDAQGWREDLDIIYTIRQDTRDVISYAYESESTSLESGVISSSSTERRSIQTMFEGPDANLAGTCGPLSAYQGREVPLDRPVVLFETCWGVGDFRNLDARCSSHSKCAMYQAYQAIGTQELGGQDAVLFMETNPWPEAATYVWYDAETPVPLRIVVGSGPEFDVLRLTRFSRGTQPLTWNATVPVGAPAPALEMAPLVDGLPDETGVEHPYSARKALQDARDSGQADEFFSLLERGYIGKVDYREFRDDRSTVHRWDFIACAGDKGIEMRVWGSLRGPLPHLQVPVLDSGPSMQVHEEGCRPPDPATVPKDGPTLISLMARWRHFASPEYQDLGGNGWGMYVGCFDPTNDSYSGSCTGAYVVWEAGHITQTTTGLGMVSRPGLEDGWEVQHSWIETPGPRGGFTRHESTYWENGSLAAVLADAPPAPRQKEVEVVQALVWVRPDAYLIAATGLAALLVALGYLLWPALKSGGFVGLFSRLHAPAELQAHPVRKSILQIVEAHPGIHVREMERRLALGRNQSTHHLAKLRDAGLLRLVAGPGYTCVFLRGTDAATMGAAAALKADAARRILQVAIARPGLSGRELARQAGISPGTLSHHLPRLRDAGLLVPGLAGLVPTELARKAMQGA